MKILSLLWVVLVAACVGGGLLWSHQTAPDLVRLGAVVVGVSLVTTALVVLTIGAVERLLRD